MQFADDFYEKLMVFNLFALILVKTARVEKVFSAIILQAHSKANVEYLVKRIEDKVLNDIYV